VRACTHPQPEYSVTTILHILMDVDVLRGRERREGEEV
jgi:hypothetical protein